MVKKIIFVIFCIILFLILVLVVASAVYEPKNSKAMNSTIDGTVSLLSENYTVNSVSAEEFDEITVYGIMKFNIEHYYVENFGNLCIMKTNVGLMQMTTLILNPKNKNLPLVSVDYMYLLGKRKSYVELFDLVENKDADYMALMDKIKKIRLSYDNITDVVPDPAWYDEFRTESIYKSGSPNDDEKLKKMLLDCIEAIINAEKNLPELSDEQKTAKQKITKQYSDGLIDKGGVSTDIFKKSLGVDKTRDFFDKVFFGTVNL